MRSPFKTSRKFNSLSLRSLLCGTVFALIAIVPTATAEPPSTQPSKSDRLKDIAAGILAIADEVQQDQVLLQEVRTQNEALRRQLEEFLHDPTPVDTGAKPSFPLLAPEAPRITRNVSVDNLAAFKAAVAVPGSAVTITASIRGVDQVEVKDDVAIYAANAGIKLSRAPGEKLLFISGSRVLIDGITFDTEDSPGPEKHQAVSAAIYPTKTDYTVRNCTFLNVSYAVNLEASPSRVLVEKNTAPLVGGIRGYFVWIGQWYAMSKDVEIRDNYVANSTREHCIRVGGAERLWIHDNDFTNLDRSRDGDPNDSRKCAFWIMQGTDVLVNRNYLSGPIGLGRLQGADGNASYPSETRKIVLRDNRIYDAVYYNVGSYGVTVENNLISADDKSGVTLREYDPKFNQRVTDATIRRNTILITGFSGRAVEIGSQATGVVDGNVGIVAAAPGGWGNAGMLVRDESLSGLTVRNNFWSTLAPNGWAQGGQMLLGSSGPNGSDQRVFRTAAEWSQLGATNELFAVGIPSTLPLPSGVIPADRGCDFTKLPPQK